MPEDIRDKTHITHDDVIRLNFISNSGPYVFRRHFRQGLRSHIIEVIDKNDAEREKSGLWVDGIRWYPKAKPLKIFRIFRTRLTSIDSARQEINRVKIVEQYLAPDYLAASSEFIVDYVRPEGRYPMLCGFQEYEEGEIVDPWTMLYGQALTKTLYDSLQDRFDGIKMSLEHWSALVRKKAADFTERIKAMIYKSGYIPDLAGIGNLIMVPTGEIKLVDINNISKIFFDSKIRLDDRGYPVSDKSIEALYLIEEKIMGKSENKKEKIYTTFLGSQRKKAVRNHEKIFYHKH